MCCATARFSTFLQWHSEKTPDDYTTTQQVHVTTRWKDFQTFHKRRKQGSVTAEGIFSLLLSLAPPPTCLCWWRSDVLLRTYFSSSWHCAAWTTKPLLLFDAWWTYTHQLNILLSLLLTHCWCSQRWGSGFRTYSRLFWLLDPEIMNHWWIIAEVWFSKKKVWAQIICWCESSREYDTWASERNAAIVILRVTATINTHIVGWMPRMISWKSGNKNEKYSQRSWTDNYSKTIISIKPHSSRCLCQLIFYFCLEASFIIFYCRKFSVNPNYDCNDSTR